MYAYFLKIASRTEETGNVCSWTYLLKNNQVRQFLKLIISSTSCTYVRDLPRPGHTAQKTNFPIKDFFSKCDQIHSFLRIWSHLLKKSLMESLIFRAVSLTCFGGTKWDLILINFNYEYRKTLTTQVNIF